MADKSHTCAVPSTTCSLRGHLLFPSKAGHGGAHPNPSAKDADAGGSQGQQDLVSKFFFPIDFLVLGHF